MGWGKPAEGHYVCCVCMHVCVCAFSGDGVGSLCKNKEVLLFALSIQGHQALVATLECCVQFWVPHYKRDMEPLKWIL